MAALNLSCPDWLERMKQGRPLVPDLELPNPTAGARAVAILNKLRLYDVPGTPTMEEAGGEWFRACVRALFGSLDPVTKARLIRELMLLVPKKNSKTTGGALLMLTALLMNERPSATLIMTAPVQDTAQMAFDAADGAIELDPVLSKKLHVRRHLKTIVHRDTKAELQIMSFDPQALTGQKVVAALIDELHVIAKSAKAASAIRQLRGGMLPFPEAFLAFITTQSEETPVGVMKSELQKARAIRDGKQPGFMLPVLYEFPEEMQRDQSQPWKDPANWPMVTPNLGKSISLDRLVEEMREEERKGEADLRAWASQHLNVEIGMALHADRWVGADYWEQNGQPELASLDTVIKRCEVIVCGVDGGGLDDLLGFCALGRETGTRKWLAYSRAWAHKIVLKRRKEIASQLLDLEAAGELVIVETPGQDIRELADIVCRIDKEGLLAEKAAIGVDTAGIGDVVSELTSDARGIAIERIIGIPQGYKLNGAIKTTERKLAAGELLHGDTGLMKFCVPNAKIETHGNADVVTKAVSGKAKIDPLMALYNCVSLMALDPAPRRNKFQLFFA